jgi:hypothetical protein
VIVKGSDAMQPKRCCCVGVMRYLL